MARTTIATLESQITALTAAVAALTASQAATSKPAQARAASPKIDRVSVCTCGATFKFGRSVEEVAGNALGLCGVKGYTAHKVS